MSQPDSTATPNEASSAHAAPCGRPDATTGQPCPVRVVRPPMTIAFLERTDAVYGPRACPKHATDNDRLLAEIIDTAWVVGYDYGRMVRAGTAPTPAVPSAGPAESTEPIVSAPVYRERNIRGQQLIVASGGYTYHWGDPSGEGDLHVGDTVLLPANQVDPSPHRAIVEAIGSAYDGPTRAVLYLVEAAPGTR